jgi:hypothetical protein
MGGCQSAMRAAFGSTSGSSSGSTSGGKLALEVFHLVGRVFPFVGIGEVRFHARDAGPRLGQFNIDLDKLALVGRHVFLGKDRIDRAFRDANSTVDALIRVDREKIGSFTKAIDRADVDTIGIPALDAGFGNDVRH